MDLQNMQMSVNANNGLGPRYFVDGLDIYGVESTGVVAGPRQRNYFIGKMRCIQKELVPRLVHQRREVLTEAITIFLLVLIIKKVLSQLLLLKVRHENKLQSRPK